MIHFSFEVPNFFLKLPSTRAKIATTKAGKVQDYFHKFHWVSSLFYPNLIGSKAMLLLLLQASNGTIMYTMAIWNLEMVL